MSVSQNQPLRNPLPLPLREEILNITIHSFGLFFSLIGFGIMIAMAAFGTATDAFDTPEPWLVPNPAMVKMFKDYLREFGPGLNIGLSWSGGAIDWDRAERTIPLDVLGPIVSTPGANIISLEYVDGETPEGVIDIPWATRKGVDLDVGLCGLDFVPHLFGQRFSIQKSL